MSGCRTYSVMSLDEVVSGFYRSLGGPGAFSGIQKLKLALKAGGYQFSQKDIENSLSKLEDWSRYRTRYRTIPRHVPMRFGLVSAPGLWLSGDSFYLLKGWKGIYRFGQVWVNIHICLLSVIKLVFRQTHSAKDYMLGL